MAVPHPLRCERTDRDGWAFAPSKFCEDCAPPSESVRVETCSNCGGASTHYVQGLGNVSGSYTCPPSAPPVVTRTCRFAECRCKHPEKVHYDVYGDGGKVATHTACEVCEGRDLADALASPRNESARERAHKALDVLIEAKKFNIQRASRKANPPRCAPRPTQALREVLDSATTEAAHEETR
jgi:hypothetical protein